MLVHDFVDLDVPRDRVVSMLSAVGDELALWAQAAFRRGEELAIGPGSGTVTAPIELEIGVPLESWEAVTIPMSWKASTATQLFPRMEAEIVVSALGPAITHLEFRGSYVPPMDGFGKLLDKLALHRVAESTVRSFLSRLSDAIETESRSLS
jgi:hypothetical protein